MSEPIAESHLARLRDRAAMLAESRRFFALREILEVDSPCLIKSASIDAHIDLIAISSIETLYLHSSPEYAMKKLLARGLGDIYQLSHVFREGEIGNKHNPEFTMAEWYRLGFSFQNMIEETLDYIQLFVGKLPSRILTYREAFIQYALIDPYTASNEELLGVFAAHDIEPGESEREFLLNVILATIVEPKLGDGELTVMKHYPANQAALAQTVWEENYEVGERFEVYYRGIELANGYHELADAVEQRRRFIASNQQRLRMGKKALPMDEEFLLALNTLPDCCGVAVGFDRLMMLRHEVSHIQDVMHAE